MNCITNIVNITLSCDRKMFCGDVIQWICQTQTIYIIYNVHTLISFIIVLLWVSQTHGCLFNRYLRLREYPLVSFNLILRELYIYMSNLPSNEYSFGVIFRYTKYYCISIQTSSELSLYEIILFILALGFYTWTKCIGLLYRFRIWNVCTSRKQIFVLT